MFILRIGGWFIFLVHPDVVYRASVHIWGKLMHRSNFPVRILCRSSAYLRLTLLCITRITLRYSAMNCSLVVKRGDRLTVRKAPIRLFICLRLLPSCPGRGQLSSWPLSFFTTGRGTKFIWRCTTEQRVFSTWPSTSFWHDITACITDTWTGTSMLFPSG